MQDLNIPRKKRSGFGAMVQKAKEFTKMLVEERKLTRLFYKSLEAYYLHIKQSRLNLKIDLDKWGENAYI